MEAPGRGSRPEVNRISTFPKRPPPVRNGTPAGPEHRPVGLRGDVVDPVARSPRGRLRGHHTVIVTTTHELGPRERRVGRRVRQGVTIGDGVWMGGCVTMLPGVTIGPGAVVLAGAAVT